MQRRRATSHRDSKADRSELQLHTTPPRRPVRRRDCRRTRLRKSPNVQAQPGKPTRENSQATNIGMGHQPNTTNPGTRLNGTGAIQESSASDTVIKCAECGTESPLNVECEYCHKTFCEKHMPEHKAWEHRHENLAEDSSRLWKRRRESP